MAADRQHEHPAAITARQVCHPYPVESAAGLLGMGKLWPRSVREKFERLMSEGRYEEAEEYLRTLEMFGKLDEEAS